MYAPLLRRFTGMQRQTYNVNCGARLSFNWGGFHDVYLALGTSCSMTGGRTLAPISTGGAYTWTATSNGQFNLICSVGTHCSGGGMQALVTVSGC